MSNAYISSSPMPFLYGIFVNLIISRKKAKIPFPHGVRKSLLLFIFSKKAVLPAAQCYNEITLPSRGRDRFYKKR